MDEGSHGPQSVGKLETNQVALSRQARSAAQTRSQREMQAMASSLEASIQDIQTGIIEERAKLNQASTMQNPAPGHLKYRKWESANI
ncbi:hypothetical protein P389DRAFT_17912 [Cystobasidium minutum MCA 4210]|uniref:uncharacterized protein n=1 Tax=Cystobasidium minutum MCA 4210 TaxID=1397322 RepID=UPI0034CF68C2|eukprot:jgi/Rhomi1/17912/CE17911_201